ncbi:hypothetical protein ASL14_26395 (plasmid) [Paenibacillus sp. IHB B 3084]|nr:hypothetical protein ASL14_26395 [Paenibacillus sp. IHB B 3084]
MSRSLSPERRALLLHYLEEQPGHAPGDDFLMYEWLAAERVLLQTGELVGPASVAADRTDSNPLPEHPASRPACPPIRETMGQIIPFPQRALRSQSLTPDQAMKYEMMNALSDELPFIKELLELDGQKIDYLFSQLASVFYGDTPYRSEKE